MTDLASLRAFLARKAAVKNDVKNVHEIIFYLKNQYLPYNEAQGTSIEDIPNKRDQFLFKVIPNYLKTFSKSIKEVENMSLKNEILLGGWISKAAKVFKRNKNMRGENLPVRFEDWIYKECRIKNQTTYH